MWLLFTLLYVLPAGVMGALWKGTHSTLFKCCVQGTSELGRMNVEDRTGENILAKYYIFYHIISVPVLQICDLVQSSPLQETNVYWEIKMTKRESILHFTCQLSVFI